MMVDYNYMRALWNQFYGRIATDPVCDEQHHHLSAQLSTEQRKELLKLIDCHYAYTDQIALESFIAGFRLATGIANQAEKPDEAGRAGILRTNGGIQLTRLLVYGRNRSREERNHKRKARTRRVL